MPVDKIRPFHDPRVSLKSAILNGFTYGYLHCLPPPNTPRHGTIVLVHGFPDISFGWRNQIPMLASLGLEVIAPDCLGYGRSDAPPTHMISAYTYRRIADDIEELCRQLSIPRIILGGHDWGGAIVWRVAQFKPSLVQSVFVVCTPYLVPSPSYTPLAQNVATRVPNFAYQLHFASGELETAIRSPTEIRNFLNAMYGARIATKDGSRGEAAFDAKGKVKLSILPQMGKTKLLSDDEMDYYVHEYSRHGMNGPLNWYRSREQMFLDDLDFFYDGPKTDAKKYEGKPDIGIEQPALFVFATKDQALPEWMSKKMDKQIPRLTRKTVEAGHWVLWEKSEEINAHIKEWVQRILKSEDKSKL